MKSQISAIGTALPPYPLPRQQADEAHVATLQAEGDFQQRILALHRASGIRQRHTVVPDFLQNGRPSELFPPGFQGDFPGTELRMDAFRRTALPLAKQAALNCLGSTSRASSEITHLVAVSCTGMYAPGLDIDLVTELGLASTVHRTAINFMGCYGAFPAMKLANALCLADPNAKVLVVCVELCSLHFQQAKDEDTLLAMALFGDGAAALLVESSEGQPGLVMDAFHTDLASEGHNDMAWKIGDFGFEMRLSAYVPLAIEKGIAPLTDKLLDTMPLGLEDIHHFAIHPGGRSILQAIERQLGISPEQNEHAYSILRECGNMSSPTVLFVLERLWKSLLPQDSGAPILSFAFGPGLTLESSLFTYQS